MDKKTKLILGVGVLAAAGYLIWKQGQKPKASFVSRMAAAPSVNACCGHTGKDADGKYICCNGTKAWNSLGHPCGSDAMKECARKGFAPLEEL